jgi:hypothetical protein
MLTKDMGFESQKLLFANIVTSQKGSFDALRQKLLSHPEIADACQSNYIHASFRGNDQSWEGAEPEDVFVR